MTPHTDGEAARILAARARTLRHLPTVQVRVPAAPWLLVGPTRIDSPAMTRHAFGEGE